MARAVDEDELIDRWTLTGDELAEVSGKRGPTRLGFAVLLKFFSCHARFPRGRGELAGEVIAHVARQVSVPASDLGLYEWSGRTFEYHRAQVRRFFGFRECTVADADKLTGWLAEHVCRAERQPERVRQELLDRCRGERVEPPTPDRIGRIIGSALRQAEQALTAQVCGRIPPVAAARLTDLVETASDEDSDDGPDSTAGQEGQGEVPDGGDVLGGNEFAAIRHVPGNVSLKTIRVEGFKLRAIEAVGLPAGVFAGVAPKVVTGWGARVAGEFPSHLRQHPQQIKVTLLAAYLHCRRQEITDTLVDLLIATVHRINAHAEAKVVKEFVAELRRVSAKEDILFRMAQAAVESPSESVSEVIYPVVPGGVETLQALLAEYRAKGSTYRQHKQRVFKASYTHHYRRGLIELLETLEFGSTNTAHAPVLQALALIKRYKAEHTPSTQYYARGEHVPVDGVICGDLAELMYRTDKRGRQRILRSVYECGVFQTLRDKLRCKEIWVVGAGKWRNPDEDLPADFEANRVEHYAALSKPLDPAAFTDDLLGEMDTELSALHDALGGPGLPWLKIVEGRRVGPIVLTPLQAAPEPRNLRRLKAAIRHRWGVVPLLDMLTETALRTGCLNALTPAGVREAINPGVLFERLLLVIYAYGTNTGIRAVAAGDHPHTEDDLRYARRRYLTVEGARQVARLIANATFAARQQQLWGEGTTAVASDSTHFAAWDQNIFTEWHSRYRRAKRGVLIYWTVETAGAMAVYSQHLACSASEVHAMVEGAMRHGTDMDLETNYVDSHGASFIGFGITRLLGFDLIARFKQINTMKLYLPTRGMTDPYPRLTPALTRPIRRDLIEQQYDLMVKYATAIRLGTASTEALLRRFTANTTHPAYAGMLEVGRAQRTIFLARWLRDRALQQETESALNVVENFNGVNDYIHFGKRGELASNRREEQELGMICLQILQASLGYINTLMIQDILAEHEWDDVLTDADRRGLTPLFHVNMTPYGDIQLRPDRRLDLTATQPG